MGVNLIATRDEKNRISVCGSRKRYAENLFSSSLFRKTENSHYSCGNYKYVSCKEIRYGYT